MAIRILTAGYDMPAFTANKMEKYCENIVAALKDVNIAEATIQTAVRVVDTDQRKLRSRQHPIGPFTQSVIEAAKAAYDSVNATA